MKNRETKGRDILVLWRWAEAEEVDGSMCHGSLGGQMRGVSKGDTLYITATTNNELFLLGVIQVTKVRKIPVKQRREPNWSHSAEGKNVSGPFRILPLRGLEWRLRFEGSESPRLSPQKQIAWQVRMHRFLAPQSADLLWKRLQEEQDWRKRERRFWAQEGRKTTTMLSRRERDPRVRRQALRKYGHTCMVCDMDFTHKYGFFASDCVEVHHLHPLRARAQRGSETRISDLIVVCPNCHRALERSDDPSAWRRFRKECGL